MSNIDLLPSTPNPNYVAIVASFLRGLIQLASGAGFLAGAYADSQVLMVATLLVAVGTLVWSFYQKLQAEKKNHDASIASARLSAEASARAGEPIAIAVTSTETSRLP